MVQATVRIKIDPSPAIAALDALKAVLPRCTDEEILWIRKYEDFFEMDEGVKGDPVVFRLVPTPELQATIDKAEGR